MSHPPPVRQQRKKAKQSTLDSEEDSEQIVSNSSRTSSSASRDASSAAVVVAQDEQQRSGSPDSRLFNSSANLKPPQQQPEDDGEEDEPVAKSATKTNMLLHYGKETLCLLAILLTTMASYQGTPKVGRPPTPRQFFPASSMVHDFPAGNLEAVSQQVSLSELSFVFYYAPWDATSQSTRALYGDVAKFYHREAYFAAINCWQPGGECRLQYSKIKAWPVLMAYLPKNGLGVLYNGPWEREPIMRFVNSFLSPLKRLNDPDDLLQEMTSHDAVVVAFVDLQRDMREWNTYYETAVRWMFRDPFQDIRFSVVTGESRSKFGVEGDAPVLRMYLWNETVEYENSTWSTGDVENWTVKNLHRVTLWMTPTGYKSMALSSFFKQGPVLLFFTPRNMLKESTDAVEMMRQIGMEYYNCHQDQWIREMVREYLPQQRRAHQEELKKLKSFCQGIMSSMTSLTRPVSSVTFANLMNGSSQQQLLQMNERIGDICQLEPSDSVFGKSDFQGHCEKDSCAEEVDSGPRLRGTSMLRPELDRKSPQNLEKLMMRRKCELLLIESEQAVHSFLGQNPFEVEQLQGIEGMGCSGNRSLTMLLMDSSIYHVFAERLGVDILTKKRKSGVLIVDPEHESTYMLNPNEDLTLKSISRFIRKFSDGSLRRHLRSSHVDFAHTHFYAPPPATPVQKDLEVELEELNSRNFVPRMTSILGQSPRSPANRSLLVFFFSSNCAFCTMMSQHLLQIGNILRPLTEAGHLKIVRIDGDKNDLPWPFTVAEYPSLIFFPGGSGGNSVNTGDSRQFVISERNSVALDKILGFVIANLDRSLRIYAIQLTCAASRRSVKPLVNCLASLRTEIEESIAVSLREWRRRRAPRTRILRRLQLLEAFYLETFRVSEANQCQTCDFAKLETYCRRIVGVWRE